MQSMRSRMFFVAAACALLAAPQLGAATLQHFTIPEMVANANQVYRGTIVDSTPTTVSVGGADLPATRVVARVEEAFKGNFTTKGDTVYTEFTMVGTNKGTAPVGEYAKLSALPAPPQLEIGRDYLLLTTAPSAVGLSTTVGLGQGSFEIYSFDKQEWAKNEFGNTGLYAGAVTYSQLADDIRQALGQ